MISSYFKRRFVLYVSFDFKKITDEHNAKGRFHDVGSFTNCRRQATEIPVDFYFLLGMPCVSCREAKNSIVSL